LKCRCRPSEQVAVHARVTLDLPHPFFSASYFSRVAQTEVA
jgi:hypothetical protein